MSKTHWFSDYKKKVRELEEYADALERREVELMNALHEAAQGYVPAGWKDDVLAGVQLQASNRLKNIARMTRPKRPIL